MIFYTVFTRTVLLHNTYHIASELELGRFLGKRRIDETKDQKETKFDFM